LKKIRAKNLGDNEILDIVGVLDGWAGKLSWELLIQKIEARNLGTYTRQALHKHERIYNAFTLTKKRIAGLDNNQAVAQKELSPELEAAVQRIKRLEAENLRVTTENHRLLEQFARWAYNAHIKGLSKEFLNQPLPQVDRERSKQKVQSSKPRAVR